MRTLGEGTGNTWLMYQGRLRSGWRIAVYLVLLVVLFVVGQLATSVIPGEAFQWASVINVAFGSLAAGWIVISHLDGRPLGALGLRVGRETPREFVLGIAIGGGLNALAALLLLLTGAAFLVRDTGTGQAYAAELLTTFVFFAVAAAAEEILLRGYAFQALVEGIGVWPAVLISSAVFSGMHAGNPNIGAIAFANIFLAGVLLAIAYLKTRSLWFATAVHLGWNWVMATLLDFPVSGLTSFDTPLYDMVEAGADWWTGGAFGPEAGLAGTLVLVLGTVWLLRTERLREPPEMRALRPLVDARLGPDEP